MGAWGHSSFENDDALDWVGLLEDAAGVSVIVEALSHVTDEADEYIEAPECSMAIAAAEVVAALNGRPSDSLPADVKAWLVGRPAPEAALLSKARQAVEAVLGESELRELWAANAEAFSKWTAVLNDLKQRLS